MRAENHSTGRAGLLVTQRRVILVSLGSTTATGGITDTCGTEGEIYRVKITV